MPITYDYTPIGAFGEMGFMAGMAQYNARKQAQQDALAQQQQARQDALAQQQQARQDAPANAERAFAEKMALQQQGYQQEENMFGMKQLAERENYNLQQQRAVEEYKQDMAALKSDPVLSGEPEVQKRLMMERTARFHGVVDMWKGLPQYMKTERKPVEEDWMQNTRTDPKTGAVYARDENSRWSAIYNPKPEITKEQKPLTAQQKVALYKAARELTAENSFDSQGHKTTKYGDNYKIRRTAVELLGYDPWATLPDPADLRQGLVNDRQQAGDYPPESSNEPPAPPVEENRGEPLLRPNLNQMISNAPTNNAPPPPTREQVIAWADELAKNGDTTTYRNELLPLLQRYFPDMMPKQ